ncbi:Cobalamin biosynthesis protein CobS [Candidatus Hodgkinia cicadicola]|uniref:Cobalamin biosynthesis protein CobS n=1 Tax=Candidatus Hodgkinia cicadicola TaxID=573658 RepID=A0ABX4MK29_9HYPH|nr:Cobalamin biosynthesis protein CobS [Candidatus Hodgkinia cicadicola]
MNSIFILGGKGRELMTIEEIRLNHLPDTKISMANTFNIDVNAFILAFSRPNRLVPQIEPGFQFDKQTTLCILAGLLYNKRVLVIGQHGEERVAHIEQVCNRLNWGCIRINMDSCLTRFDLIGRESIVIQQGRSIVKFKYGLLPWVLRRPIVLVLDNYNACKPETKFIFNKLLEANRKIIITENGRIIRPNACFRILATSNTLSGSQVGTFQENSTQLDRWNFVVRVPKLSFNQELVNQIPNKAMRKSIAKGIVELARLSRHLKKRNKLNLLFPVKTPLTWSKLSITLIAIGEAFKYAYLNKCERFGRVLINKKYIEVFKSKHSTKCC